MCKLATVTGPLRAEPARKILAAVNSIMSCERDGFGFVSAGSRAVACGKYMIPDTFGGFGIKLPPFFGRPAIETGMIPPESYILLMHGRTSTNHVTLHNCHPFYKDGKFITHNGVLNWAGKGKSPKTKQGSDTEAFFNWMLGNPKWIHEMDDAWSGWAAMFILDTKDGSTWLIKDSTTSLYGARRRNQGWVLATTKELVNGIVRAGNLAMESGPVPLSPVIVPIDRFGEFGKHLPGPRFKTVSYAGVQWDKAKSLGDTHWPKEKGDWPNSKFPDYEKPIRIKGGWHTVDDDGRAVDEDDPQEYTVDQAIHDMDQEEKALLKIEQQRSISDLFPT